MTSRGLIHFCFVGFFILAVMWVLGQWGAWARDEKVIHQLLAVLLLAVAGGLLLVLVVLPRFGDAVGTAMFSSGEEVGESGGMKAAALIAQGDYEGAIEEYQKALAENPEEPHPVSEIAKICADKLNDPVRALHVLQTHLEGQDWTPDHAAFLMFRMVDVHAAEGQHSEARELLEQIIGHFPDTRHSANAKHRLQEIEQEEFKLAQARRGGP